MEWPRSENKARDWLQKKLGMDYLPEEFWQHLFETGFIHPAINEPSQETYGDLERAARQLKAMLQQVAEGQIRRPHNRARTSRKMLSVEEIRRAEALSKSLGYVASRDRAVVRFRNEALSGVVLSPSDALAMLSSPVHYLLTVAELHESGAFRGGYSTALEHQRKHTKRGTWIDHVSLRLRWGARSKAFRFSLRRTPHDGMWLEVPPVLWGKGTPFENTEPLCAGIIGLRSSAGGQSLAVRSLSVGALGSLLVRADGYRPAC